ncbi:exosortase family protein XrtF [Winogradskyella ursingii]|uniref:exosortase family protein XrtF n=1 Tax=Winogradskyella ursingii TaxID=2686079 RepID=UPI0015CE2EF6|nr:exosortase family protein XrtF [Winogradskyella ursingii]
MKALLIKYKLVIRFILLFLLVYGVLTFGYNLYLNLSTGTKFYPDYATHLVAKQTEHLLNSFGYDAQILPHPNEPSMKLILNNKYLARIIEGCNAISIINLFVSFIIAFSGRLKTTLLYCFVGSVIIYIFNLIRIVVLSIGLYHYPEHEEILHTVIFPMLIYGIVFLLWMFWVNRFSKSIKQNV